RTVSMQVQIAGSREWRLVAPVGFQETQVRGLLTAEEPPLVEDHGPRPDGEDQQDQENDLGDQPQGGKELNETRTEQHYVRKAPSPSRMRRPAPSSGAQKTMAGPTGFETATSRSTRLRPRPG